MRAKPPHPHRVFTQQGRAETLRPGRSSLQAASDRLDEGARRTRSFRGGEPSVVVTRRSRRLHVGQRQTILEHGADAVADDRHHVAVVDDVGLVDDAAVPGHDVGTPLLIEPAAP